MISQKIKHVFVLVQENHTFDNYFGLFPGVNGQTVENLASATAQADDCEPDPEVPGSCQRPFLITTNKASANYVPDAPDINGGNNNRDGQETLIDHGKMDGFLVSAEGSSAAALPANPTAAQIQSHNSALGAMSAYDCDTVPYLWYYAKNFALFDHYFQGNTGQSTPGNIQLFAGQIGQTEAAAGQGTLSQPQPGGGYSDGVPISNDNNPPQSTLPFIAPYSGADQAQYQSYASLPVLLNPGQDSTAALNGYTGLIPDDLKLEGSRARASIPWAWYEEGLYAGNFGFSSHHTAPLYFDYINKTGSPFATQSTLRDNTASNGLLTDIQSGNLPTTGVFWVKGGNKNSYGFQPADSAFAGQYFQGDDDHPGQGSSDHQVAEAYLATMINAIANSKYWADSVIIVTWDDSGGLFDHLPPAEFGATCPEDATGAHAGYSCGDGVRLPMLVISPFAKTGTVVHDVSDSGSVAKLIEEVFGLPTLGSLPDEQAGVAAGLAPLDVNSMTSDLTGALDMSKLSGASAPNPASLAIIPGPQSPPSMNCATLGITPIASPASLPAGFETAGYYTHLAATGQAPMSILKRQPNDQGD